MTKRKSKLKVGSINLTCPQCKKTRTFRPHELKECHECGYGFNKEEILKGEVIR